jgi:hypothetical protein
MNIRKVGALGSNPGDLVIGTKPEVPPDSLSSRYRIEMDDDIVQPIGIPATRQPATVLRLAPDQEPTHDINNEPLRPQLVDPLYQVLADTWTAWDVPGSTIVVTTDNVDYYRGVAGAAGDELTLHWDRQALTPTLDIETRTYKSREPMSRLWEAAIRDAGANHIVDLSESQYPYRHAKRVIDGLVNGGNKAKVAKTHPHTGAHTATLVVDDITDKYPHHKQGMIDHLVEADANLLLTARTPLTDEQAALLNELVFKYQQYDAVIVHPESTDALAQIDTQITADSNPARVTEAKLPVWALGVPDETGAISRLFPVLPRRLPGDVRSTSNGNQVVMKNWDDPEQPEQRSVIQQYIHKVHPDLRTDREPTDDTSDQYEVSPAAQAIQADELTGTMPTKQLLTPVHLEVLPDYIEVNEDIDQLVVETDKSTERVDLNVDGYETVLDLFVDEGELDWEHLNHVPYDGLPLTEDEIEAAPVEHEHLVAMAAIHKLYRGQYHPALHASVVGAGMDPIMEQLGVGEEVLEDLERWRYITSDEMNDQTIYSPRYRLYRVLQRLVRKGYHSGDGIGDLSESLHHRILVVHTALYLAFADLEACFDLSCDYGQDELEVKVYHQMGDERIDVVVLTPAGEVVIAAEVERSNNDDRESTLATYQKLSEISADSKIWVAENKKEAAKLTQILDDANDDPEAEITFDRQYGAYSETTSTLDYDITQPGMTDVLTAAQLQNYLSPDANAAIGNDPDNEQYYDSNTLLRDDLPTPRRRIVAKNCPDLSALGVDPRE